MNTIREELIDFFNYVKSQVPYYRVGTYNTEYAVDSYLKSINSSTSDETLTLGNNEQIKKICPFSCDCYFKSN